MAKPEWGAKRTCPSCEARFYDLRREPVLCPECGATFNVDDRGKVSGVRERRVPVPVGDDEDALVDEDLVEDAEDDAEEGDPLLADEEEDEEPAGPALADEDEEEGEAVAFEDPALIDDDDLDEDSEDEDGVEDEIDVDELPDDKGA